MTRSQSTKYEGSLGHITIFGDLAEEDLASISQRCVWRRFGPGQVIVDYLEPSDEVFFIASGEVRVTIYSLAGKEVSLRDLGPGEVFGEYPAIDDAPRSASVAARTDCLLASVSAAAFRDLLANQPKISQALLRQLVGRIRALTTRVYEFSTLAVNNRIQAELLRLAALMSVEDNSARISPVPTHSEIASRVSTHREAVTRELNRLSRLGLIERSKDAILVKDVDRLRAMVQEASGE